MKTLTIAQANTLTIEKSRAGMAHVWMGNDQVFKDPNDEIIHVRNEGGLVASYELGKKSGEIVNALFDRAEEMEAA